MFVTRASERAFPPRDFPTVLALSSAVALIEIVKSFMGASIVFFNSQLSRDSCRVMRKCWEFRLICYPSTKLLPHLTQSRHNRNNKMLLLLSFLPLLVCFVLVFAFSCVCASFPFFLFLFCAVCVSICFYPSIVSDSFGWLISDFLISSFPHFLNSSSRQPDKPDKVKKNYASSSRLSGIWQTRRKVRMCADSGFAAR